MDRDNNSWCSYLHCAGALFQEWIVIQWAKTEQERLLWVRTHQDTIRRELYDNVVQASLQPVQGRIGTRVVLPSSFVGGPRYMSQMYQDGMAIVRKLGKADLFVTFTANPNWPEVLQAISSRKP